VSRVVIADDHTRVRAGIRESLERGNYQICAEAATAREAVSQTLEHRPEVCLLDIHMPGNGIRAAREIGARLPEVAVVMLTNSQEESDLFDALRAGAKGYLLKTMDPDRLPAALDGVLAGEAAVPRSLVARILDEFQPPARRMLGRRPKAAARLSPREWEVMELLAQGESTEQTAQRLFMSPNTVRVHVSSVLRKLRVKDREAAFSVLREN
jgi:DNA-binding NarL/FixJ family response regulator